MRRGNGDRAWIQESSLFSSDSAAMYVVIGLMGTANGLLAGVVGYFVDVTLLNLHAAVWLFLLSWAVTTSYLSYKRVPSGVLAVGLYFIGLLVLLHPVVIYVPRLVAATDASGATSANLLIEGWRGIFIWGSTAGVLALVITFVSRLLKRHADDVLRRRRRYNLWSDSDD